MKNGEKSNKKFKKTNETNENLIKANFMLSFPEISNK